LRSRVGVSHVTPSVIFIDRRSNKYVGSRAHNNAAGNPDNPAVLFKRLMGTSTPVKLPAVNLTMTPEECFAEVLRTLFGYLPEEIRADGDTGTVITVPAAFNQMQKDATMAATDAAGPGRVALRIFQCEPAGALLLESSSCLESRRGFLHRVKGRHEISGLASMGFDPGPVLEILNHQRSDQRDRQVYSTNQRKYREILKVRRGNDLPSKKQFLYSYRRHQGRIFEQRDEDVAKRWYDNPYRLRQDYESHGPPA
jgi:hypothetical protein